MLDAFDAHQRRKNLSDRTIAGRRTRLQGFARYLHARGKMLHDATAADVEDWFDSLNPWSVRRGQDAVGALAY